jgi:succinate dehydrogenase/fumarate reductase cytochrome b subunit
VKGEQVMSKEITRRGALKQLVAFIGFVAAGFYDVFAGIRINPMKFGQKSMKLGIDIDGVSG